jgi:hypothetical protein
MRWIQRGTTVGATMLAAVVYSVAAEPDWEAMPYTRHADYQAIDDAGGGTFPLDDPIKMRGVILNRSEAMLDSTASAPAFLGGLWQIYVQSADDSDFGGTACWMGQLYGRFPFNPPEESYTDEEWLDELDRLRFDADTGRMFQPGDLVEVRARAPGLHFRGKTNVNEQHLKDPAKDFDVVLLEADHGVPAPAMIRLADLVDENNDFLFDATRATGCERYQGSLVRIEGVELSTNGWAPDEVLRVEDDTGRSFPIKLGRGAGYDVYLPPADPFTVVAVLDQEDESGGGTGGYRLWVPRDYDGNGWIVGGPSGDFDASGSVDLADYVALADCLGGPGVIPSPVIATVVACREAFDFDYDTDIDVNDFETFQRVFRGR